jgi:catechol 2,3-dioxygenase-like lactoylglutathione lyase family enzyme
MRCATGTRRTFDPMAIELNHTIVASRDKKAAAKFVTDLLGLSGSTLFGPFEVVELSNGVSLDFMDADEIHPQHYAFLLTEDEFDQVFGRIKEQNLTYWADPMHSEQGEINTRDGGRGVYFDSPDGHYLEILTRPYGSGG